MDIRSKHNLPHWLWGNTALKQFTAQTAEDPYPLYTDDKYTKAGVEDAVFLSSEIGRGQHILLFDCDFPVYTRETSPGKWHVAVNKEMSRSALQGVLFALAQAGVVETGYEAAVLAKPKYGATLRWPWVKKGEDLPLAQQPLNPLVEEFEDTLPRASKEMHEYLTALPTPTLVLEGEASLTAEWRSDALPFSLRLTVHEDKKLPDEYLVHTETQQQATRYETFLSLMEAFSRDTQPASSDVPLARPWWM